MVRRRRSLPSREDADPLLPGEAPAAPSVETQYVAPSVRTISTAAEMIGETDIAPLLPGAFRRIRYWRTGGFSKRQPRYHVRRDAV